jgi:hypothetical protein
VKPAGTTISGQPSVEMAGPLANSLMLVRPRITHLAARRRLVPTDAVVRSKVRAARAGENPDHPTTAVETTSVHVASLRSIGLAAIL